MRREFNKESSFLAQFAYNKNPHLLYTYDYTKDPYQLIIPLYECNLKAFMMKGKEPTDAWKVYFREVE